LFRSVSDRLSAFDVILPDPIPYKGAVLNQISAFWFQKLDFAKNHFITANFDEFPQSLRGFRDQLAGRSMLVKKTEPLTIECVVRGYLAGSGWKDYQQNGSVCGVKLPDGLQLASKLPGPIFTSTNNLCAIIWRRSIGTKRRPRPICRGRSWRKRAQNTAKLFRILPVGN